MDTSCHRCGGELPLGGGTACFCPHCGAPQLYLREHLLEDLPVAAETTGTLPPPDARRVDWQPAIRAAIFVALVAPALCLLSSVLGVFSIVGFLWILSGPIIAIGLYHKQRPTAYMDAATGARIGIVVGLLMASVLSLTIALSGIVGRFALHEMSAYDSDMATKWPDQVNRLIAQAAQANPSNPIPPSLVPLMLSPEFRAAMGLFGFGVLCVMLLAVSTLGGAFAGLMRTRARIAV